jgi:hypothetical protein
MLLEKDTASVEKCVALRASLKTGRKMMEHQSF